MSKKFFIVCVLYNREIQNIVSLNKFHRLYAERRAFLIIIDNSDNDMILNYNRESSKEIKIKSPGFLTYMSGYGNIGLSRAYNIALKYIKSITDNYALMLSDDDTAFSYEYLCNAFETISSEMIHIVSGLIRIGDIYYSPVKKNAVYNFKSNFIHEVGVYENIYCINSGLILDDYVCKNLVFNEDIFLMMGDYWLMDYLISRKMNRIQIVSGDIQQDFSVFQNDKEASLKRYKIFKKDFSAYCNSTGKNFFYKYTILIKRRIHIMLMRKQSQQMR